LILVLSVTSSACYQYFPVHEASPLPEPGQEVRAQLSPPISLDLGTMTIHDVSAIEGDVYGSTSDTLALFSRWLRTSYGGKFATDGAVFYFRRSQFRQLEARRFVPVKTGLAAGAAAVTLTVAYVLAMRGAGGSSPPDAPGDVEAGIVVPLPVSIRSGRR
ncbi:MAG: hypothetical protein ACE5JM_15980, partial [Armatimonadota bacterium]